MSRHSEPIYSRRATITPSGEGEEGGSDRRAESGRSEAVTTACSMRQDDGDAELLGGHRRALDAGEIREVSEPTCSERASRAFSYFKRPRGVGWTARPWRDFVRAVFLPRPGFLFTAKRERKEKPSRLAPSGAITSPGASEIEPASAAKSHFHHLIFTLQLIILYYYTVILIVTYDRFDIFLLQSK